MPNQPTALEAEQAVLGSMLIESDAIVRAGGILQPADFYRDAHRGIYQTITTMHERGDAVDLLTLREALHTEGVLTEIGGIAYLTTLASSVPTAANVEHYAKIVRDKAVKRRLMNEAHMIITKASEDSESADRLAAEAADRMMTLATGAASTRNERHIKDILSDRLEAYDEAAKHRELPGWPTCIPEIDHATGGLQKSDLIIGAGRSSSGKTAMALQMAVDGARRSGKTALFFELEMSRDQLADRLVGPRAGVDPASLRNGMIGEAHWTPISRAIGQLSSVPLIIDDDVAHTTDTIWATTQRIMLTQPVGLIVVDYIQLLNDHSDEDDNSRYTRISRRLKAMARKLNLPVLALSQLNRESERGFTSPRPPRLSDLRGSGTLGQDADVVWFVHYDEDHRNDEVRPTQFILAKQRNGPAGDHPLMFDRPKQRFMEITERHSPPAPSKGRMGERDD